MKIAKHCLLIYAAPSLAALTLIISDSAGISVQFWGKGIRHERAYTGLHRKAC